MNFLNNLQILFFSLHKLNRYRLCTFVMIILFSLSSGLVYSQCTNITVKGNVNHAHPNTDCTDGMPPYGDNVINAEIRISSIPGASSRCSDVTDLYGFYECDMCITEDYVQICVITTCDNCCGYDPNEIDAINDWVNMSGTHKPYLYEFFTADVSLDNIVNGNDLDYDCAQAVVSGYHSNTCRFIPVREYNTLSIDGSGNLVNPFSYDLDNCITVSVSDFSDPNFTIDFYQFNLFDLNGDCNDCIHGEGGDYPLEINDNDDIISLPSHKASDYNGISVEEAKENIEMREYQEIKLNYYPTVMVPSDSKQLDLQVFNMEGKIVLESKFPLNGNNNQLSMNTFHLHAGVYILKYITEKSVKSQKIFLE